MDLAFDTGHFAHAVGGVVVGSVKQQVEQRGGLLFRGLNNKLLLFGGGGRRSRTTSEGGGAACCSGGRGPNKMEGGGEEQQAGNCCSPRFCRNNPPTPAHRSPSLVVC